MQCDGRYVWRLLRAVTRCEGDGDGDRSGRMLPTQYTLLRASPVLRPHAAGYQIAAVGKHCVSTVCTYVAPKPTVLLYVDTRIKSTLLETLELGLAI